MALANTTLEDLDQNYLTISQFANVFGITRQAIHSHVMKGRVRVERYGKVILIPKAEVGLFRPVAKDKIIRLEKRNGKAEKSKTRNLRS